MRRCIQLAQGALGLTYPNPMVGSVIVYKDRIVGEGYHRKSGTPHAEVHAIADAKRRNADFARIAPDCTIYVSLEPCSHYGRTPPCADLIIENKIGHVVMGMLDPHDKVAGKGMAKIEAAGIAVTSGILEQECYYLNRRFIKTHIEKKPHVILKWAQSLDGKVAPATRDSRNPVWITTPASQQRVHQWRAQEQAILVGGGTLEADNPSLTTRKAHGPDPIPVLWSRTKPDAGSHLASRPNLLQIDWDLEPSAVLDVLHEEGIQSIIIEGGTRTLQRFIDAACWDEARVLTGAVNLGPGVDAPTLDKTQPANTERIDSDLLHTYYRS